MIQLNRNPNDVYLELGAGNNPLVNPRCRGGNDVVCDIRICYDQNGNQITDFQADFNSSLPIGDSEFDGLICQYALEHISWRAISQFLKECFRVLKSGKFAMFTTSNTREQFQWILNNPNGWDGKSFFESASCVLYGDQDYPDNTHKAFFDETILFSLFTDAGFADIDIRPYGERKTDLFLLARKPLSDQPSIQQVQSYLRSKQEQEAVDKAKSAVLSHPNLPKLEDTPLTKTQIIQQNPMSREEMFDKHYFNGGGKVGGYAREGYRDFPVHELTYRHILLHRPKSVLELGAARGYIGKRLEDTGIKYRGLEISHHCWMTRVSNNIIEYDFCKTPWPEAWKYNCGNFDLSFSIATLEHVPEHLIQPVLKELGKFCKSHLHGIDFGENDDGFDKTHTTLRDINWWKSQFSNAGLTDYTIVSKEELERWQGNIPELSGDGKIKLNIGSFTNMFLYGWLNIDVHDLNGFAQSQGYQYLQHDVRKGLPQKTGTVDYIFMSHFLEHLTYEEAKSFLTDCRRVLKEDTGCMRIIVPDAANLMGMYTQEISLDYYNEINDGCEKAYTELAKLHALLHAGHPAVYDSCTLSHLLSQCGLDSDRI